jgi:hypothetical protein
MHWFPGNFIPQLPAFLIQILSKPGQVVLDPFGGSGTTAIEGMKLGRRMISSDRVSACAFLARGKVAAARRPLSFAVKSQILAELTWSQRCETDRPGRNGEGADPSLEIWYAPPTLRQLRYLWHLIEEWSESDRDILEMLFSDLLFACASTAGSRTSSGGLRRHHWGWVADNVKPKVPVEHDAIEGFRMRLLAAPEAPIRADHPPQILQDDARNLSLSDESVDLIVTSPPYIGVIDYVLANRMMYLWMGWPLDADRSQEIGARFKRKRTKARMTAEYFSEMAASWREFRRVLRPGAHCAVIIGESRAFPGTYEQALASLEEQLPKVWGPVPRTPSRRRVSDRQASEAREVLAVYRKP